MPGNSPAKVPYFNTLLINTMDKTFNRRGFLRASFLGAGSLLVSLTPLKSFSTSNQTGSSTNPISAIDADALYKQAKAYFYKKDYKAAEGIYLQLIEKFPQRVVYYDGYAKVLGAQQKLLEIAELYRVGLNMHEKNPYFMHRLATSLKMLCTENRKAEKLFVENHGVDNLLVYSAELLLSAIAIKNIKGFMLDLRDIPTLVAIRNEKLSNKGYATIEFPDDLKDKITTTTASIEGKWTQTRASRKEAYPINIDADINKLKNKKRRELFTDQEKLQREAAVKHTRKRRWKKTLSDNIATKNPAQVDKYGLNILSENINDTDTIGKMRKFYLKNGYTERLITLNRYLYSHNDNLSNTLSLASTLINYSKESTSISESNYLLEKIKPYLNTLAPTHIGNYYITKSQIDIKNGKRAVARASLLIGIERFNGFGGIAYTLIEKYASSYTGNNINSGIAILNAICNKIHVRNNDVIWPYVDKHIEQRKEKPLNNQEKIKHLIALSKLQKKAYPAEYNKTLAEIGALKAQI